MSTMIDRSNVNPADDYATAHKAGVTHAYFKASEGTTFTDTTYVSRRKEAHAAGIVVGAYHFGTNASPTAEADHFLSVVGTPAAGHLRPCLDLEDGQTTAWAEAFVKHIHSKLGFYPVLYGSTSFIVPMRNSSTVLRGCSFWRAEYGPNDGGRHALQGGDQGAAAHQYTSEASIHGVTGRTDASAFLSPAGLAGMLVPGAPAKKWPKPDHYGLDYTDAAGHRQHIKTNHPGLWQSRHPRARWRGELTITPVFHPVKK